MDRGENSVQRVGDIADLSWEQWPDGLRDRARQVLARLRAGQPGEAVDLIDELMSDLMSRRETLAESANRAFEPSTDDRNP